MSEHLGVTSLEDVLYDAEGTTRAETHSLILPSSARASHAHRDLQINVPPPKQKPGADVDHAGERLVARRSIELQDRYQALFWLEERFPGSWDHSYVIASACQVLEMELSQLLVQPAQEIATELVDALHSHGKNQKQTEVLKAWSERKVPATIGIASLILLALRRALEQSRDKVSDYLCNHFRPSYQRLLANKKFGACLDRIREKYRNPACHGTATFTAQDYQNFVQLVVATNRFHHWLAGAPLLTDEDAGTGILHHHLIQSQNVPEAPILREKSSLERLLDLVTPRSSALSVSLEMHPAETATPTRDIHLTPTRNERPFRLGDQVQLAFEVSQESYLTIIDVGTSGSVAVVIPNAWHQETLVSGGARQQFPDSEDELEFTLGGEPGKEKVIGIASLDPLPFPLEPSEGNVFCLLEESDLAKLVSVLKSLDKSRWAITLCEVTILPEQ